MALEKAERVNVLAQPVYDLTDDIEETYSVSPEAVTTRRSREKRGARSELASG